MLEERSRSLGSSTNLYAALVVQCSPYAHAAKEKYTRPAVPNNGGEYKTRTKSCKHRRFGVGKKKTGEKRRVAENLLLSCFCCQKKIIAHPIRKKIDVSVIRNISSKGCSFKRGTWKA